VNQFESPKPTPISTEQGRFDAVPMCQSLTGECARKFKKALELSGGDSIYEHVEHTDGEESTNGKDERQF
jgi:hypothetical protein